VNNLTKEQKELMKVMGSPNSSTYQELKNDLIEINRKSLDPILIQSYATVNDLGRRAFLPLGKTNSYAARLANRSQTLASGNGIIDTPEGPRYMTSDPNTGMVKYGPLLETMGRGKLAMNAKSQKNPNRQRMAIDMFQIALKQNPELTAEALESMAARKYEMSNAKGKEAHHMYPISYSGRVMNAIQAIGLEDEVLGEMLARKLYVGDQARNIVPLQTKVSNLGPSEYLNPIDNSNNIDIHDKVHARMEEFLGDGGLPVRTNVSEGSTIEDFLNNPDKSNFQKVNYALAVPEAARAAVMAENLDLSTETNKTKMINTLIDLAAVKAGAMTKMSPMTEDLLKSTRLVRKNRPAS